MAKIDPRTARAFENVMRDMQIVFRKDNPYEWVKYAFPWNVPGSRLENIKGPREWQRDVLLDMATFIKENKERMAKGEGTKTYKIAISSGRGIGKSALVAQIALWMMSCHLGSTTMVTANTDDQLSNRTFAEISKWVAMSINADWFEQTQRSVTIVDWLADALKKYDRRYWYIRGSLWSEEKPDSFAAVHNDFGELVIFDEASGIPAPIWKVVDGIFTEQTPYKFHICLGNPRSNDGPFYDCFYNDKIQKYWITKKIDARSVEGIPQETYQEILDKYGPDSRDARVEVYGEFPETGDNQFFSRTIIDEAIARPLEKMDDYEPLVIGVDPARFGDDDTVIRIRRGRDARSYPTYVLNGVDNMTVANKLAEVINEFDPAAVFIDSGGGAGIIDRLREMAYKVFEVNFGRASEDPRYFDHGTELWGRMRDWLSGGMIGDQSDADRKLITDLMGRQYEYMGRENRIKLEAKDKMKKRSSRSKSPDNADALALTFHVKIASALLKTSRSAKKNRMAQGVGSDIKFD